MTIIRKLRTALRLLKSYLLHGLVQMSHDEALADIKLRLLLGKTWRYLRYIHARNALSKVSDWQSVCIVGAGYGFAELALALEYPDRQFVLTDHADCSHTNIHAKRLVKKYNLKNVTFEVLDILQPPNQQYDVVYSVEVLEHIKDDALAARNMVQMSRKYTFCLVPFADQSANDNQQERERVWKLCEHYVVGYDAATLERLFPNPIAIMGCYWADKGIPFRKKLTELNSEQIEHQLEDLTVEAELDLIERIPSVRSDALGIWILSSKQTTT